MRSPLRRWIDLDQRYQAGTAGGAVIHVAEHGRAGLIFSAPHSVRHRRRGVEKAADMRTGGLAELLAESVGGRAVSSLGRLAADPNFDLGAVPFRERLLGLLRPGDLVVDLHGMGDTHGWDAVIGLGARSQRRTRLAAEHLREILAGHGLRAAIGRPFPASHPGTVTSTVQAAGWPALQVEIAACRRRPLREAERAEPMLAALLEWVRRLAQTSTTTYSSSIKTG